MTPAKFKEIREQLKLSQTELATHLGVKTYKPISHYETGFRTPSLLIQAVMSWLSGLSEKEAVKFLEQLKHHMDKVQKSSKRKAHDGR
ncbi:MAG: helix-turn-helix transcriptional regulator [Bdellovibrionaceae bacterium]|nr:helix-turn-helix transcriptional regulator [Pseudobdellovibrionaceae bacterium]